MKPKLPEGFTWVDDAKDWPDDTEVIRLAWSKGKWVVASQNYMSNVRRVHKDHPEQHRCVMRVPEAEYERRFVVENIPSDGVAVLDGQAGWFVSPQTKAPYTWPDTPEGREKAQAVADALERGLQ